MSSLSYIFPITVARYSTRYNRDIRVLEERGKYKLLVNGSRQSGEYIKLLWQKAFAAFSILPSPDVRNILVLGVAGGTVIHLLHNIYPGAAITGVDIDKKMIEIGEKYFALKTIAGLTLATGDAGEFVAGTRKKWDMIVIDIFIGATIPPVVAEEGFLEDLKGILSPNGKIVINYLYELEYKRLSGLFKEKLEKIFSSVRDYRVYFNRFFFVVK